jgi:hypothetical protein
LLIALNVFGSLIFGCVSVQGNAESKRHDRQREKNARFDKIVSGRHSKIDQESSNYGISHSLVSMARQSSEVPFFCFSIFALSFASRSLKISFDPFSIRNPCF